MYRIFLFFLLLANSSLSQTVELVRDGGFESQTPSDTMPSGPIWYHSGVSAGIVANNLPNQWAPNGTFTGNNFLTMQSSGNIGLVIHSNATNFHQYTWSVDVLARPGFTNQGTINIIFGGETIASFNASTITTKTKFSGSFFRTGAFSLSFFISGAFGSGVAFDNVSMSYDPSIPAIKPAGIFTDNAVLQRDASVPVWGWALPDENLILTFNGQTKHTTADANGKWSFTLDPMVANSIGQNLTITSAQRANRSYSLSNMLVGEVWMISGQSNAAWTLGSNIPSVSNPLLRVCIIPFSHPEHPAADTTTSWVLSSSAAARNSSAAGYFFGNKLQTELNVPVGVITSARGSTVSEQWTPEQLVYDNANYSVSFLNDYNRRKIQIGWTPSSYGRPGDLYNGMISPIMPYRMKGVLWSQAEGSKSQFDYNHIKLGYMINAWRNGFNNPNLAWIATAAAPYIDHNQNETTRPLDIRPVQDDEASRSSVTLELASSTITNFWSITIIDSGTRYDIHPPDKRVKGDRFAKMALGKVYNLPVEAHGPKYSSMSIVGNKANVTFNSVGGGLVQKETNLDSLIVSSETLQGFDIAGADRVYYRANGRILNSNTVELSHPKVPAPVAVRFAWSHFPIFNLFSAEGLPPYPFTTDNWGWKGAAAPQTTSAITSKIIADNNQNGILDSWERNYFGNSHFGTNPSTSDSDNDSLSNLAEFAFNLNPVVANNNPSTHNIVKIGQDQFFQFSIPKNSNASDIGYIIEISDDLSGVWSSNTTTDLEVISNTNMEYTVRDRSPVHTKPKRFMRGRVNFDGY